MTYRTLLRRFALVAYYAMTILDPLDELGRAMYVVTILIS